MLMSEKLEQILSALHGYFPKSASHQGKVRDSFRFTGAKGEQLRLVVVTDRRSIFDFQLGFPLPGIGHILNGLNLYWRSQLDFAGIEHDLVAFGAGIDLYLPEDIPNVLRKNRELQRRAVIVRELEMLPIECVYRLYLTGSFYKLYASGSDQGFVYGHQLAPRLMNGSKLDPPLFTPTTKAETGHDMPLDVRLVRQEYPGLEEKTKELFKLLDTKIRGGSKLLLVDGKVECGRDPNTGRLVWADEIGTPDSCRFWAEADYKKKVATGTLPDSFDKEILRDWGRSCQIDVADPNDAKVRAAVRSLRAPQQVLTNSRVRIENAFSLITGRSIRDFQEQVMGVSRGE